MKLIIEVFGKVLFLLVFAECTVFHMEQIKDDCPPECICTREDLFVNCSRLSGPIPEIPSWATSIILQDDGLTTLPTGLLSRHRDYNSLDMTGNQLTRESITADTFRGVRSVQFLSLSYNPITDLPADDLPRNVSWLLFVQCQISYIREDTFTSFVYINHLDLSMNPITSVHPDAFTPLGSLSLIYLEFNNLTSLPQGLFQKNLNLTVLGLRFNPLGIVPSDLPQSLTALDLVGTNLTHLPKGAFKNLRHLENLALWQNPLRKLDDFAFEGLSKVTYMDMTECQVPGITKHTFAGLTSLQKLFMYGNNVTAIEPGAFSYFEHSLQEYWLCSNKMHTLDASFDAVFRQKQVSVLYVYDNPWYCDCRLKWLKVLQEEGQLMLPHLIMCTGPGNLKGKAWDQLTAANFTCPQGEV